MIGIYLITNTDNNKVYVGQSVDVNGRLNYHKRNLEKNTHPNQYLQRSYNKHGKDVFKFEVIEECTLDTLDEREVYWISYYQSTLRDRGYNRESGGHEGKVWCEESRQARCGEGNPMYGRHHSEEYVNFIREHNQGINNKLSEDDVRSIKHRLADGECQRELAEEYEVDITTISKIAQCINWKWVEPELNNIISNITANKLAESARRREAKRKQVEFDKKKRQEIIEGVRRDFQNGVSKQEIIEKYKISTTCYVRYTTDLFNERKQQLKEKCWKLRQSGMMVKDIAEKLSLHRTTVTEYCKAMAG